MPLRSVAAAVAPRPRRQQSCRPSPKPPNAAAEGWFRLRVFFFWGGGGVKCLFGGEGGCSGFIRLFGGFGRFFGGVVWIKVFGDFKMGFWRFV